MYLQLTCSNCGHHSQRLPYDPRRTPTRLLAAGWRNFGSAWYCARCVGTWEQRNGPNRPLCGPDEDRLALLVRMVDELVDRVDRLERMKEGDYDC
ncbi:MAG: hypothetical protein ACI4P5_00570 [Candidatus Fimadaptatus sp.]